MIAAGAPAATPLRFQVGARTLATVRKRLVRAPLSLADVLAGEGDALPPLPDDSDGLLVTSLPVLRLADLAHGDHLAVVRQRYVRRWVDLTRGYDRWWAGRSAQARAGLRRKVRRLDAASEVRRYATPEEIAAFLPLARGVAATTYQDRLLGAALPDTPPFVAETLARATADEVRGWLLFIDGAPAAYLFCTAERDGAGDTLRYDHDPAYGALSPGGVLQLAALRDLMAERRFARLDFLEGDGQHKRLFASDGVECCDVLLLRRTLRNRALAAVLTVFDAGVARAGSSERLRRWTRALRR